MLLLLRSPLTSVAPPANTSSSTTPVRSTLPVLSTVMVYSIVSPAVSTTASSAFVSYFTIVSAGLCATVEVASSCCGAVWSVSTDATFTRAVPALRSACVTM